MRGSFIRSIAVFLVLAVCTGAAYFMLRDPRPIAMVPKPNAQVAPLGKIKITFDRAISPADTEVRIEGRTGTDTFPVMGDIEYLPSEEAIVVTTSSILKPAEYSVKVYSRDDQLADWNFNVNEAEGIASTGSPPILIVQGGKKDFSAYYGEILRAEGFTDFTIASAAEVRELELAGYEIAIVAGNIDDALTNRLEDWVEDGGNLVAIQPSGALAQLAGVATENLVQTSGYLSFDTGQAPGAGLVKEPIQFHGQAARLTAQPGTSVIASLRFDGNDEFTPAATVRSIGSLGGEVSALAFDLALSVMLTRQGNPAWAGQDRDGLPPIRPNDLFFGNAKDDPQPDYLDLEKVAIPQADETMRFLSNLMLHLQRDGTPLPRFWYFPKDYKAAVVMAADDHGTKDGTRSFFQLLDEFSPKNCSLAEWECARATSWIYASSGLTVKDAEKYAATGFSVGSHISTDCKDWTRASLNNAIARDLGVFQQRFPSLPTQVTSRLHCIVWSDYLSHAEIERSWGIRLDMNYYYWPESWLRNRSGFMTGSGLPMRYGTPDGEVVDVYQQETHLVDEIFNSNPGAVDRLIESALGPDGFYGAFGTHIDFSNSFATVVVDAARKWNVPMISADQLLAWQDARSQSTFEGVRLEGQILSFAINTRDDMGEALTAMLPLDSKAGRLLAIARNGEAVAFRSERIKGVDYAMFPGGRGHYSVTYETEAARNEP
ncbi:MAG: hypothetical protein M9924_09005 [Rhizobiaceae bacterium]|nr:hypothetical protein [Rhizobiaceae bacterium]